MSTLTEIEVIKIIRAYLEGLFPKNCSTCQRRYFTLREYLLTTQQLGSAVSYDLEADDWKPGRPLGTITFANCACGNTIALSSEEMSLGQLWPLCEWAKAETQKRKQTHRQVLNDLRDKVWKEVLEKK